MLKYGARSLSFGLIMICATTAANAASPYGTWLRPSTGGQIAVYPCRGGLGLKVVRSKDRAKVGKVIMCGAMQTEQNNFRGSILNLDDGNTYTGKVRVRGNLMDLSGCVLGGAICKTETWKRIK